MRIRHAPGIFVFLLALVFLTGCLFRTRIQERHLSTAPLKEATLEQLIANINSQATRLQSVDARVDIDLSASRQKKGKANEYKVTDYPEISGFVLVRKPEMLRIRGLVPVARNQLFDAVSNGRTFELSIPPKNKFIVGSNRIVKPSAEPLYNLRPQHIFDALLLKEVDPKSEIAYLEQGTEVVKDQKTHKDVDQADYEVVIVRHEDTGWNLSRKIIFSREDLQPHRQLIYNRQGQIMTDAQYDTFTNYSGILFPAKIHIDRPLENYSIELNITKLTVNAPLRDDQFVLNQPPGSQLINVDQKNGNSTAENSQPSTENPKPMH